MLPALDNLTTARSYFIAGGAIKALGDGRIGGYLVAFGSPSQRDSYGEYFDHNTDFQLTRYNDWPVLYHHELDETVGGEEIGRILKITPDDRGLYAEAQLDMTKPIVQKIYKMVVDGKLGWSSGSVPHWVDTTADGYIERWPIVEGSLTPTPAEPRRTTVSALRSAIKSLLDTAINVTEEDVIPLSKEPSAKVTLEVTQSIRGGDPIQLAAAVKKLAANSTRNIKMGNAIEAYEAAGLSAEQIVAVLKELGAAEAVVEPEVMADVEETAEEGAVVDELATMSEMTEEEKQAAAASRGKAGKTFTAKQIAVIVQQEIAKAKSAPSKAKLPGVQGEQPGTKSTPRIEVISKYADLSAEDMDYLRTIRAAKARTSNDYVEPLPTSFKRELVAKAQAGIKAGKIKLDPADATRILAIKDNELDNTGNADAAGDWVPTLWSSDLWERVRVDNDVARQFQVIDMPSPVYELPLESTDPTVYKVPETTNEAQLTLASSANPIPDSVVSANKTTLTAVKMGLRVGFSAEIMEDSIIQFIPQLRAQAVRTMQNAIDNVLLNGDTDATASTNINDIAGTPAATDKFLVFNGLRKLPLVTNAALSIGLNGATPTLQNIRQIRFLMQSTLNVYANRPQDLAIFVDVSTYGKLLNIDELLVYMNNGRGSTVNDGSVPSIDGVPVYASAELSLSNINGKVNLDDTTQNRYGQLILAARPAWKVGYRRQLTSSVDYLPYYDSYQMTNTVRMAFINKDTVASSILYGIGLGL